MKKYTIFLVIMFLSLNISGCQGVDVNNTAVVVGMGVEQKNDLIEVTAQIAKPLSPEESGAGSEGEPQFIVISETGKSTSEAARKINLTLPRVPLWTYANIIILGENLTKSDISLVTDTFARNPNIRKNSTLVIAKGASPEEIMQVKTPLEPFPAQAVRNMLEIQEKQLGIYTRKSLGDFLRESTAYGLEPLVPQVTIVKTKDKKLLQLDGSAAFRGSRIAGHLNERETRGHRFVIPGSKIGGFINVPSPINPEKFMAIELLRSQTRVYPEFKNGEMLVKIEVNADGNFWGQNSADKLLTLQQVDAIEKLTGKEIEKDMTAAIKKAQELKSDIFGWGKLFENRYPDTWQKMQADWPDLFPEVQSEIEVKFELRRSYLTDESFVFR